MPGFGRGGGGSDHFFLGRIRNRSNYKCLCGMQNRYIFGIGGIRSTPVILSGPRPTPTFGSYLLWNFFTSMNISKFRYPTDKFFLLVLIMSHESYKKSYPHSYNYINNDR